MMDLRLGWRGIWEGLVVIVLVCGAMAADDTSCISELASCANYLNSTAKPDKSCCDPLVSVIDKDPQCLCRLLTSGTVKQLGVNVTRAMELPAQCGKNASASQCTKAGAGGPAAEGGGSSSSNSSKSPSGGSSSESHHTETDGASGRSHGGVMQAIAFALAAAALPTLLQADCRLYMV